MTKTRKPANAPVDVQPRRSKILCTMGPAMDNPAVLEKVFRAGANAFRVNFSHGDHAQHGRYLNLIRSVARKLDQPVAVLADLMGPKVRVDTREYDLVNGTEVWLVPQPGRPEKGEIGISFANLAPLVRPGQRLLLDDGQLELSALGRSGKRIRCRVERGGRLKPRKTLNVPGVDLGLPVLSAKDKDDLRFIAKAGFDWVASSFIRHGEDVRTVKRQMRSVGMDAPVVAKVESAQAIDNLRSIIEEAEGVMVARGDMGVELDLELIPTIQRNIIHLAREMGKVTIIATQMLESMTNSPRPTRAEVTDVAAAALARVDVLMLSGETAAGRYPAESVAMMDRTIRTTERRLEEEIVGITHPETIAATCEAGLYLSLITGAKAVACISTFGNSPRILSTYRGNIPVMVGCTREDIANRSTLYYAVHPISVLGVQNPEVMFKRMEKRLKAMGTVKKGDVVVFVYGNPIHARNNTNSIRRWEIG